MSLRPSHAVVPAALAATLLLTWPLAREIGRSVPRAGDLPDPLLQAYVVQWDLHALATRPLGVFDAPIFHPERRTLTYMDHLLGEAAIAAPAAAATGNPASGYDVVVLFSFVATIWATYRLLRLLGVSVGGGFLGGLLFALAPYRIANLGNLNLLQTELLPLGLFTALRFARERRTRDLAATALVVAAQSYLGWYYTFYLVIAIAVLFVVEVVAGRLAPAVLFDRRTLLAAAAALVLMLPGLVPYLIERRVMPGFGRTLGSTALYSADPLDYLRARIGGGGWPWPGGPAEAAACWPGLVSLALAIVGALAPERRIARPLLAIGIAGFVLSLGPVLRVAGHRFPVPLPYAALFYAVPGFSSMRAPSRFSVLVLLAVVTLAAAGYDNLRRRLAPRGAAAGLLFGGALVAALVTSNPAPLPMLAYPQRSSMPAAYAWLARQPGDSALLEIPLPAREQDEGLEDAARQIESLYHGKPILDGVSGFVPPRHREFRVLMQRFPAPATLQAAAERGARWAIVHYGQLAGDSREHLRREATTAPGLVLVAEFGTDVIYEITPRGAEVSTPHPG